jgi:hypothetical protein
MKTEYNIKDRVWIHIGERKLVEGRVVEIIDLAHLNETHNPDRELYVIEIKTGIDDIYEVRSFEQISPDAKGPINLFRNTKTRLEQRALKHIGMIIPNENGVIPADGYIPEEFDLPSIGDVDEDEDGPTPEQIHAAMEAAQNSTYIPPLMPQKKKRYNNRGTRKPQTAKAKL